MREEGGGKEERGEEVRWGEMVEIREGEKKKRRQKTQVRGGRRRKAGNTQPTYLSA